MPGFRFPFIRPQMPAPASWIPYLDRSYAARRYSNFGPANELTQERLERFICAPARRALLASSATDALAAVLMGLGIQGEVAVPSFTFPATVQSALMAGCIPVFCDADAASWELSPETIAPSLSRGVQAVIHVRAFGLCRDLSPISEACDEAGIPLIVDSAAALGGRLPSGQMAGAQGTVEVFSLHVTKPLGIGEGGLIVCQKADHDTIAQSLNFGLGSPEFRRALNGKLNEFSAAIGLAVLDSAEETLGRRSAAARGYANLFRSYPELTLPINPGAPPWPCFPVLLPPAVDGGAVLEVARTYGLELRRYYRPALHTVVPARLAVGRAAPVSEELARRLVCFPVYPNASDAEQTEILHVTAEVLAKTGIEIRGAAASQLESQ